MRVFHRPSLSDDHKPVEICGADPHKLGVRPTGKVEHMKCSQCIAVETRSEVDEPSDAVTVYRGTALCRVHLHKALAEKRYRQARMRRRMSRASA